MERRKFLIGIGAASAGGSAVLGSGAFSRVESDRHLMIEVAEDPDAYLGLDACDSLHGDEYVDLDDDGHLYVDVGENAAGGQGVNSNSRTWFDDVFQVCNQGTDDAHIWIEKGDDWPTVDDGPNEDEPRVDFYLGEDEVSILGEENATEVQIGECHCIGIKTNTHGVDATAEETLLEDLDDVITLVADTEAPIPPVEEAFFEVTYLDPTEVTVEQGRTFDVSATITNTGDATGEQDVDLYVDGDHVDSQSVSLDPTDDQTIHFDDVATDDLDGSEYTFTVATDDDQASGTLIINTPAFFEVTDIEPGDVTVEQGETVEITATIENTGDFDGEQDIELLVGGDSVSTTPLSLANGASEQVSFELEPDELSAGEQTYSVSSNDDNKSAIITIVLNDLIETPWGLNNGNEDKEYDTVEINGLTFDNEVPEQVIVLGDLNSTVRDDSDNVEGTEHDSIYVTSHHGWDIGFEIPVSQGTYAITLHWAETWYGEDGESGEPGEGARIFEVIINGETVLPEFDIYAEAGGAYKAIAPTFLVEASDGIITIEAQSLEAQTQFNGIEIHESNYSVVQDWQLESKTNVSGDGYTGVGHSFGDAVHVYEFGVGVNETDAPTSPSSESDQFYWTADDYQVGETPDDSWEPMANVESWVIQEDYDGKYLEFAGVEAAGSLLRFTEAGPAQNIEVWARLKAIDGENGDYFVYLRGTNEDGDANAVRLDDSIRGLENRFSEYVDGEWSDLGESQSRVGGVGDLYEVRGRLLNETVRAKWDVDSESPVTDVELSGRLPHLAWYGNGNEAGAGAVVDWQDTLYVLTYRAHAPGGSDDKLYMVDHDLESIEAFEGSVGGTPANRMIHEETNQLLIGPYVVDDEGEIEVIPMGDGPSAPDNDELFGRLTATARHLHEPETKAYYFDMEGLLYEVDVTTLEVELLYARPVPGWHAKGGYSGQGRLVLANNGEWPAGSVDSFQPFDYQIDPDVGDDEAAGILAEWDGEDDWQAIKRRQFTDVTSRGGIRGPPDDETPLWAMGWDRRSLLLMVRDGGQWHEFRLPKHDYSYDGTHGWHTEWPRIREAVPETEDTPRKILMNKHGGFFDFPESFSADDRSGLEPLGSYLKIISDIQPWSDEEIVFGPNDASGFDNPTVSQPNSNLWFSDWNKLSSEYGRPAGGGGVWMTDDVTVDEASTPFLFAGYDRRVLHVGHESDHDATIRLEIDPDGDGSWQHHDELEVPANGYAYHVFDEELSAEWIRLVPDDDLASATAYFHYGPGGGHRTDEELFAPLADVDDETPYVRGIARPRGGNSGRMHMLATEVDPAEGSATELGHYEIGAALTLRNSPNDDAAAYLEDVAAIDESGTAVAPYDDKQVGSDAVSAYVKHDGTTYRLPKGHNAYDETWPGGHFRGVREAVTERALLNAHGTFYVLPRNNSGGVRAIKPVATHNKRIIDWCSWRGLLALVGVGTDASADHDHVFESEDGEASVWLGDVDDLWRLGKPRGVGGPWAGTDVEDGTPSDPYLMAGFDEKRVELSHTSDSAVSFTLEVDVLGAVDTPERWVEYETVDVPAGETVEHTFPDGYQAQWIRLVPDADTTATAIFYYDSDTLNVDIPSDDDGATLEPVTVDNDDPNVSITGEWPSSSWEDDHIGDDYLHDNNEGKGEKTVEFTPELSSDGDYEVFAYWNSTSDRGENVPIDIGHDGGTDTVTVDQTQNGGQWNSLGTYSFTAGAGQSVTIRNDGTSKFVIADAVKFEPAGGDSQAWDLEGETVVDSGGYAGAGHT